METNTLGGGRGGGPRQEDYLDETYEGARRRGRDGGRGEDRYNPRYGRNNNPHNDVDNGIKCVKLLQSWNLKFSGDDRDEPNEFLERLADCRASTRLTDRELLEALPCVFQRGASAWYRTARHDILDWNDLEREFRNHFIGELCREDLFDELRERKQGKNEPISKFVSKFLLIVSYFQRPPSVDSQLEIARRNLLPEYRAFMRDREIYDFEDMKYYGRLYEKERDIDRRYSAPPPRDKVRIAGAAYDGGSKGGKLAAVKENGSSDSESENHPKNKPKPKKQNKKNSNKNKSEDEQEEVAALNSFKRGDNAKNKPQNVPPTQAPSAAPKSEDPTGPPSSGQGPVPPKPDLTLASIEELIKKALEADRAERLKPREPRAQRPADSFPGACYICEEMGHRSTDCPKRTCYSCGQMGHYANTCPKKQAIAVHKKCGGCGKVGFDVITCPACKPIREAFVSQWGNGGAGV